MKIILIFTSLLITQCITNAVYSSEKSTHILEEQLKLRDQTIIELLERVETLEQRVGLENRKKKSQDLPEEQDKTSNSQTTPPGAVIVKESDAERALERSLTVEGALLLPSGVLELEPGIQYTRRESSSPDFAFQNNSTLPSQLTRNTNLLTAQLALRLGLPWDSQLEINLPYSIRQVQTTTKINFAPVNSSKETQKELGDLRLGFAKTLVREALWRPDLIARLIWDSDSGETGGFNDYQASLTALKRQDPVTLISNLSYQYSHEKSQFKPGSIISGSIGSLVALSPETSMRFLVSGSHQFESEQNNIKISGSERLIGSFVIGGSTLLVPGTLLNFSVNIGLTESADDFNILLSLPIRLDNRLF